MALRFRQQLNENANQLALVNTFSEMNHNEIVGWTTSDSLARFSAVFLGDTDATPRIAQRVALTRELLSARAAGTHVVATRGETSVERVFSLLLLGDLVSVYSAILGGHDPRSIAAIDELKSRLAADA